PNGKWIELKGARAHNLKNVDVRIPLGMFVAITGVSGSGKSTLLQETFYPRLRHKLHGNRTVWGEHDDLLGAQHIDKVIDIDQSPIGRTPRSNPATYTGVFTFIRTLFTRTPDARMRGYRPGRFSFNVKGGRCEACQGDGLVKIEMHFLPDVYVTCEVCKGRRYNRETLDVHYKAKNFADIQRLIDVLNQLVDQGNTVVIIEHNLDVIKTADWIIDLGPEGGDEGGRVVATGTPEDVARVEASYTAHFLRAVLA